MTRGVRISKSRKEALRSRKYVGTRDVHIPRDLKRKLDNSNNPNRVVSSTDPSGVTKSLHIKNNQVIGISKASSRSPPPLIGSMDTSHILDTNINPYTGKPVHPVTADLVASMPLNYKADPELKKDMWYKEHVGYTTAEPKGGGDPINIHLHTDIRDPLTEADKAWNKEPSKKWWEDPF